MSVLKLKISFHGHCSKQTLYQGLKWVHSEPATNKSPGSLTLAWDFWVTVLRH